jgi:hypothetical protein
MIEMARDSTMQENIYEGVHEYYTRQPRHWDPQSEPYTGGDSLLTALRTGWTIQNNHVIEHKISLSGGRMTTIYYVLLMKATHRRIMPVITNPFVERLLERLDIVVKQMAEGEAIDATPLYIDINEQNVSVTA